MSFSVLYRATLALAQLERKVSQGSRGLRVVPVALASPVLATLEPLAFPVNLEILVYLGYQGNQVYLDREVSVAAEEQQKQKEEREVLGMCVRLAECVCV